MATEKIPVPKPGEGEPIVFFDITLGGEFSLPASFITSSWATTAYRPGTACA